VIALLSLITVGFFLGMRHATDPDHVIAVATIVSRQRSIRSAALIGVAWGIGHSVTILVVGGGIILFSVTIPPRVGLTMELIVGVMLVLLGVVNLSGVLQWVRDVVGPADAPVHSHAHAHGDYAHSHVHGHGSLDHGHGEEETPQAWLDRRLGRLGLYQALRPLVVGVVHGLAGSAAVALLVLTTIRDPAWATAYLILFAVGTVSGMMLITAAIAAPFAYTAARLGRFNRHLRIATGFLSVAFGLFLIYQIGFRAGLFTGLPVRTH
jgi:ABC-type nickel/cobalt efflux system permease component RcnA